MISYAYIGDKVWMSARQCTPDYMSDVSLLQTQLIDDLGTPRLLDPKHGTLTQISLPASLQEY